jgi:Kdo2-lipid IVA lauroyltransferase/acyltransferase
VSKSAEKLLAMPQDGPRTWPVHGLLTALTWFVAVWPAPISYALFRGLGAAAAVVTLLREPSRARRGRGAMRNMRIVFGDAPGARRLVWAYGRHLAWLFLEVLRMRRLGPRRLRAVVDASDLERVRALAAEGRGLIVASGHMGNWEVLSYAAGVLGLQQTVLARPLPEPGLERWIREHRARAGQRVLSKFGGTWPLKKALDRRGIVGLNVDENARDGLFVPFFGVLAGTNATAALLQRVTGAPIAVVTCQRLAPDRFKVHVWAVVRPDPSVEDKDAEARRVMSEVAAALERPLRAYPEQWLWALRRWETRPDGEQPGPDGLPALAALRST